MITMHVRPRRTDGQTNEHHGNSATIRSDECVSRYKIYKRCAETAEESAAPEQPPAEEPQQQDGTSEHVVTNYVSMSVSL